MRAERVTTPFPLPAAQETPFLPTQAIQTIDQILLANSNLLTPILFLEIHQELARVTHPQTRFQNQRTHFKEAPPVRLLFDRAQTLFNLPHLLPTLLARNQIQLLPLDSSLLIMIAS